MQELAKVVGTRIAQGRSERGWSQADLARHLDKAPQVVNRWENGANLPNDESILKLAEVFAKPRYWFFMAPEEQSQFELVPKSVWAAIRAAVNGGPVHGM